MAMMALVRVISLLLLSVGLLSCGGGGNQATSSTVTPIDNGPGCDLLSRRTFIALEFRDEYLWTSLAPDVDPTEPRSVDEYFRASVFAGNESIPFDRYSGYQSSESYSRFFGEGLMLGYGLAVAGLEIRGQIDAPLWVRDVWPSSPADLAGVRRGDRVVALNGRASAKLIESNDFSMLNPLNSEDTLEVDLERDGLVRNVRLKAAIHPVTPLRHARIIPLADGKKVGLIRYQAMSTVDEEQLFAALSAFRDASVSSVILDLRYNGGGLVSVGQRLASHLGGDPVRGSVYAQLRYNERRRSQDAVYYFNSTMGWSGVRRVFALVGPRTCSASEQVISGLRGVGIDVVTVGSTTCGKPVGFTPNSHCGTTYSIVNFESFNAVGDGRYFAGIPPTCRVEEDFRIPLDAETEPLLATAVGIAGGRRCPTLQDKQQPLQVRTSVIGVSDGPGLIGVMVP